MMNRQLVFRLDEVAGRMKRVRRLYRLALCWTVAAVALFALMLLPKGTIPGTLHVGPIIAVTAAMAATVLYFLTRADRHSTALAVERRFPALDARLLTAIEQQPHPKIGRLRPLQRQVIDEVVEHSCREDWRECVPATGLKIATILHAVSAALFAVALAGTMYFDSQSPKLAGGRQDGGVPPAPGEEPDIDPGDTSLERGRSLLVLARFKQDVPTDVFLVYRGPDGATQSIPMTKSLNDPLFGARVAQVDRDMQYRVDFDRHRTRDFDVTVFEFPELEQADALVHYPDYASLPDELIEDTRQVSAVEGSQITLRCRLNKSVATARLVAEDKSVVSLESSNAQEPIYEAMLSPTGKQRYRLELVDAAGRTNQDETEFLINILPNRRPDLQFAFPGRDIRVSPLEEVSLKGTAWDDFGVEKYGFVYQMADGDTEEVVLGSRAPRREKLDAAHLLAFEKLDAEPGQLVSYYLYADDFGPDGAMRRTFSDMFFAEVRHFEEIFRQGNQPPGGASPGEMNGQGQGQQMNDLLDLQKQIMNATWNLVRRETSSVPSDTYGDDVGVIKESQESALPRVAEMKENVSDPESRRLVDDVARHMTTAALRLGEAAERTTLETLPEALGAEQSAYQALLNLESREHEVIRGQAGSAGAGGAAGRSQQQLQQLELNNNENRYETQRSAESGGADPNRSEQLQILNRLRELARRQQGLNQLYKELENALRDAKSEEEKEEIRRRLKRLRDQQTELLRDVDELNNRMEQPENARQTTSEREQLERTRSNVRRASEALEEGQVSKALAAGTRAERELQDLQNDFRQKAAGRFADEMRDLRESARELADREQQLAENLDNVGRLERQTLRKSQDREEAERALTDQRNQLDDILNRIRRTTEEAQLPEPLLAKRLYETIRQTRETKPQEFLEATEQFLTNGLLDEAVQTEKIARQGIEAVRRGVEEAAEGVIGSEVDALKRARQELDDLVKAVASERPPSDAESPANDASASSDPSERPDASSQSRPGSQRSNPGERAEAQPPNERSPNGRRANPDQASSAESSQQADSDPDSAEPSSGSAAGSQAGRESEAQSERAGGTRRPSERNQPGQRNEPGGRNQRVGNSRFQNSAGRGLIETFLNQSASIDGPGGPLTGSEYEDWSDRLREVEEIVADSKWQAEIAQIRDSAKSMRREFIRHSKEPNWDLVNKLILQPMVELQSRLDEEISKHETKDAMVPIDRDPIPARYEELVRRYYERLGSGE